MTALAWPHPGSSSELSPHPLTWLTGFTAVLSRYNRGPYIPTNLCAKVYETCASNHHDTELRKASIKHFYCNNKTWNAYVVQRAGDKSILSLTKSLHRTAEGEKEEEKSQEAEISRESQASKPRRCWSCDDQHHFLREHSRICSDGWASIGWWVYKQHLQFKLSIKVLKI